MCGWNGYTFQASNQVYEWVSFSHQNYITGVSFSSKKYMNGWNLRISIWKGTIFAMECIWTGLFLTSPCIWMEWGLGTPAALPYPKPWQVNPPPPSAFIRYWLTFITCFSYPSAFTGTCPINMITHKSVAFHTSTLVLAICSKGKITTF